MLWNWIGISPEILSKLCLQLGNESTIVCKKIKNRTHSCMIHSLERLTSFNLTISFTHFNIRTADNWDPAGNSWGSRDYTPATYFYILIVWLAHWQDIIENWPELRSTDMFGGRECCLWVSRCVQMVNVIHRFLEDDFVFVTPSFPGHLLVYSLSHLYG